MKTLGYGYCQCGCGNKTEIAPSTYARLNWTKGEPRPFFGKHATTGDRHGMRKKSPQVPKFYELPGDGICQCGCGGKTSMATVSNYFSGIMKGQYQRYMRGHGVRPYFPEGSTAMEPDGYMRVKATGDPHSNSAGWAQEHRVIMAKMIGRPLLKGEVVHHKNHIRHDNRPENLELIPSVREHQLLHARERGYVAWARKYDACVVCGKSDKPHASHGRCTGCYRDKLPENRWSKRGKFTHCLSCGTSENKHMGRGLCSTCYMRSFFAKKLDDHPIG